MKTRLLLLFLNCVTIGAFGQGVVQFITYYPGSTPPVDARVTLWTLDGTPLDNANTLWRAALNGGPTTGTPAAFRPGVPAILGNLSMTYNPTATTLAWTNFRGPPNQGYVSNANVERVVPGVDWGGTALVQMVAWQGNYDTWAGAFAAWQAGVPGVMLGASNPLTLTLPSGPTDPNLTYLTGLQSFVITVPEPAAFAFAGLGFAVLSFFRRRN